MEPTREQAVSRFQEAFLQFDLDAVPQCAAHMVAAQVGIQDFLNTCMPLMETIGQKYEAGEYYLPQLVVAGEMFKTASAVFKSRIKDTDAPPIEKKGKMILGTPKGDIHNLGKDIFGVLSEASGFEVHDLGIDVPPEQFIAAVEQTGASIVGMSCLLTTTFDSMLAVVEQLEAKGLRRDVFVIIGGGATEKSLVAKLKADAQTRDAYEGIRMITQFTQSRKEAQPCRKQA